MACSSSSFLSEESDGGSWVIQLVVITFFSMCDNSRIEQIMCLLKILI